jgi:demethylmenaquinone methyltransferase/2-methoxy-6-polyprenyl-1,4-benzoquinol methylase
MDTSQRLPDYYRERYVSWYSWFSRIYDPFARLLLFVLNGGFGGERRLRELVIDRLELGPEDSVVDICSGTGSLALMIGERLSGAGHVTGVEISSHQMAIAGAKAIPPNVTLTQGDAQEMAFPDSLFDRAVIFGALHEIPREARSRILSQAHRVLRPGGRFVVLEHNTPSRTWRAWLYRLLEWPTPEYPTYRDLMESGLTNEVSAAGFEVITTEVVASEFFQVVVAERP